MIRNLLAKPALVAGLVILAGFGFTTLTVVAVALNGMHSRPATPFASRQFDPSAQGGPSASGTASSESAQASVSQFDNEVAGQTAPAGQSAEVQANESQGFDPRATATGQSGQYAGQAPQYGAAPQYAGQAARYTSAAYTPQAYASASWTQQASPDRTAYVAIPSNWRIMGGSQGVVAIQGPEGESVLLGLQFYVAPNQAGYMAPEQALAWFLRSNRVQLLGISGRQPVQQQGGQAEMITAQTDEQGHKCKIVAVVRTMPIGMGYWMFHISALDAPADRFEAASPTMSKIYNSWKLDPAYVQGHFDHAAQVRAQTAASVTAWAQSNVHRWDNFNQETDRILRGQSVIENTDSGRRGETQIGTEQQVLDACRRNGQNCREVPPGELDQPQ